MQRLWTWRDEHQEEHAAGVAENRAAHADPQSAGGKSFTLTSGEQARNWRQAEERAAGQEHGGSASGSSRRLA